MLSLPLLANELDPTGDGLELPLLRAELDPIGDGPEVGLRKVIHSLNSTMRELHMGYRSSSSFFPRRMGW